MSEIKEMINISYFDNKNTNLKEHCDIYSNIKKEILDILNKYDIKYVVAETEAIRDLVKENQQLKEKLEASEKARLKCLNKIKTLGKFDGEKCTRSFTLWSADFNELVKMLDIDKGE